MRKRNSIIILSVICIMVALIGLGAFVFHSSRIAYQPLKNNAVGLFDVVGHFRQWANDIAHWRSLADENQNLKSQLEQNLVSSGALQASQSDVVNLRRALNLANKVQRRTIPAGLFNISLAPDGYTALVNIGKADGVVKGDTVVSVEGVLIGVIAEVFSASSRVTLLTDPTFQVTARVLSGTTTGIARGALTVGMRLDLIVQADEIKEGDTLVSSGDDMIPGGLIIGTVRTIQNNAAQLFKNVLVEPAAHLNNSQVIIIQP